MHINILKRTTYSALTIFLLATNSVLRAQVGTEGAILGVATDPSGAVIAGAQVTVTNLDTGLKKTAVADSAGSFEILPLPRGPYSVSVSFQGFKTWTLERTQLTVGELKRVSPVLEVGEVTQTISVEGQAELIQTEKGSIETIVEEKAIRELPLNGRSPIGLVGLVPGMRQVWFADDKHRSYRVQGVGQRDDQTNFQLDGVSSVEGLQKSGIGFPSVETIAEFNVETSNFTAEHGSAPLQVLMATKAGTNAFHGSVWEFLRNDKLDARNTFATTKPKLRRNQFGFTVGGPIIKNKTFFFGSYEGTRIRQDKLYNAVTPAAEMFRGDFSSLSNPIMDPLTGQPFPGNIIPDDRITSASKFFFPYILKPNSPGNLFRAVAPQPDDLGIYSLRIDQQLTANQRIYGRLVVTRQHVVLPDYAPEVFMDREVLQHNDSLSYTWNVNPTTLLTASAGYIRSREFQTSNLVGKENLTLNAGIQGFQTEGRAQAIGLPDVSFTGYTGFATPWGVPDFQKIWNENYKVNMNLIRGAHSISFGYEFQDGAQSIIIASCCSRGNFGFSGQYTGDGFADYLLGLTSSSLRNFPIEAFGAANAPYSGLYVQDFWKLGPKLTVNLGMRYDYWHERAFVRGTGSTFDLKLGKAVAGENEQRQVDLTAQPVSRFLAAATKDLWISATEAGLPTGLFVARGILTPRLGIAWRPLSSNDLVIRAGYGIFPSIYIDNANSSSIVGPPYWTYEAQGWSPSQLQRWETAWPTDPSSFVAPSVSAALPDLPNMKSHQWNFSIQKGLPGNSAITASYVGNKGVDLTTYIYYNAAPPGQHDNLQAARPYPAWGDLNLYDVFGYSDFHSLQVKWERRFADGLSYQFSYAFSKHTGEGEGGLWDPPTPYAPKGYDHGRSLLHRTHLLTVNGIWEVPVGRGKKHLNNLHTVANGILGGWQFSSIYNFSSGTPLNFDVPGATLGNGSNTRPNLSGDLKVSNPSADLWFNPQALTTPPLYTFGNLGKGVFDGPGTHLWDTALSKNFYIRETKYLQFRWETFNAVNHVNLSDPVTTINLQGVTGKIFSTRTPARSMQFGLKFTF